MLFKNHCLTLFVAIAIAAGAIADIDVYSDGTDGEKLAAQESLVALTGDGVNEGIVAAMKDAETGLHVAMLKVLAKRHFKIASLCDGYTVFQRLGQV